MPEGSIPPTVTSMSPANRTIEFPANQSIGRLSLRPAGSRDAWAEFAEARGIVAVPCDKELSLRVAYVDFDPAIFLALGPDDLSEFSWVSAGRVTDAAVAYLQHLRGLQGLALWETNIGDEALVHLRHLSNLRWLDIGDTDVTDSGLAYLSEMTDLRSLTLLNDNVTERGLTDLQTRASLEHLDVMNTPLTDSAVEIIETMTGLKHLRIFGTQISERGYGVLRAALPECRIWFHRSNDLQ